MRGWFFRMPAVTQAAAKRWPKLHARTAATKRPALADIDLEPRDINSEEALAITREDIKRREEIGMHIDFPCFFQDFRNRICQRMSIREDSVNMEKLLFDKICDDVGSQSELGKLANLFIYAFG